jgi:flagellar biosynthetic protein FliR
VPGLPDPAHLPALAFSFALILARLSGLFLLAPGLGEAMVPMPVRAGLAAALAALLVPVLQPQLPDLPPSPWGVAAMLGSDLLIGAWFGFLAQLATISLSTGAQIISYMIGLSNVLVPDLSGGQQTGALARLFGLAPPLLLLSTGLYAVPLSALVASYHLLPAGALPGAPDSVLLVVRAVGASFSLAVRVAGPFLVAHTAWQVALGAAGRLAPALHLQHHAIPVQVLGGTLLLAVAAPLLLTAWFPAASVLLSPDGLLRSGP